MSLLKSIEIASRRAHPRSNHQKIRQFSQCVEFNANTNNQRHNSDNRRHFSSGGGGGGEYRAQAPGPKLKSWESGARLVKNISVENQYLEHIREVHDPSQHLKTIEDELRGTIGKALGKQGQKILSAVRLMEQEYQNYQQLIETGASSSKIVAAAKQHNKHRKQAIQARWELMVHRQAVGFVVGNHQFVQEKFPIGEELPEEMEGGSEGESEEEAVPRKQFSDQLEWWQKIGRWR
jgi:hypothetical protein